MVSLPVKYRPKTFDDMVWHTSVIQVLKRQIETGNIKNAYLFAGHSGNGKTTCAKCFASLVNSGSGTPIEIDAASNNGVDNIRSLVQEASERSLDSKYKVIILDECQALTNASWQALLKTIEEPPKFTIFILCTTDPQKIPETILNRVQRFNFGAIPYDKVVDRLRYVCEQEGFTNYEESIECIGKACNGCMREALTLLGKVADSGTNFDIENTLSILGEVPVSVYTKLINYLIDGDENGVLSSLDEIEEGGTEIKDFISALLKFVVDVAKYILFNSLKSTSIPETFENEIKSITNFDNAIGYYNYVMDKLLKLKMDITSDEDASTTVRVVCLQIARMQ